MYLVERWCYSLQSTCIHILYIYILYMYNLLHSVYYEIIRFHVHLELKFMEKAGARDGYVSVNHPLQCMILHWHHSRLESSSSVNSCSSKWLFGTHGSSQLKTLEKRMLGYICLDWISQPKGIRRMSWGLEKCIINWTELSFICYQSFQNLTTSIPFSISMTFLRRFFSNSCGEFAPLS